MIRMGLKLELLIGVIVVCVMMECNEGAVYKVGDSAGWTTIGNVDYKAWASSKTFHLGDIIVFEYNPQFHNVMQVTHAEYRACNASSPISTHTTGNDSITITTRHHHLFLCGVPGHCQAGQKVDINVRRGRRAAAAPSPAIETPSAVPAGTVPTVTPNGAATPCVVKLVLLLLPILHFPFVLLFLK